MYSVFHFIIIMGHLSDKRGAEKATVCAVSYKIICRMNRVLEAAAFRIANFQSFDLRVCSM